MNHLSFWAIQKQTFLKIIEIYFDIWRELTRFLKNSLDIPDPPAPPPLSDMQKYVQTIVIYFLFGTLLLGLFIIAVYLTFELFVELCPYISLSLQILDRVSKKKLFCVFITLCVLPKIIEMFSPLVAFKCSQFFILCLLFFPLLTH